MPLSLKPLAALLPWRSKAPHANDLYCAIVARARLPVFYQGFGVPDTLDGRFVVLSLHLFAVLHRLNGGGDEAARMAQGLADRFTADMETVLREIGVGDLAIPKRVRKLAAEGAGILHAYELALDQGEAALEKTIEATLPLDETDAKGVSARLTPYLMEVLRYLETVPVQRLCSGRLSFLEVRDIDPGHDPAC
jgi:cytochrome b pre-mRNA-processing protein 3